MKAVIPGWSDFDSYPSPMRPYGLLARGLMKTWSDVVGAMGVATMKTKAPAKPPSSPAKQDSAKIDCKDPKNAKDPACKQSRKR